MQITPKYRKTVGSLLMVAAFVSQWVLTELESASAPNDISGYFDEVRRLQYETLFHQTHDLRFLESALHTQAMQMAALNWGPDFKPETSNDRFKPIVEAQSYRPTSLEDYVAHRDGLSSSAGRYWHDEWVPSAIRRAATREYLKYSTFAISLLGLLLVWSGEAFDQKTWRVSLTKLGSRQDEGEHD